MEPTTIIIIGIVITILGAILAFVAEKRREAWYFGFLALLCNISLITGMVLFCYGIGTV